MRSVRKDLAVNWDIVILIVTPVQETLFFAQQKFVLNKGRSRGAAQNSKEELVLWCSALVLEWAAAAPVVTLRRGRLFV